jgi:hypothetical protein
LNLDRFSYYLRNEPTLVCYVAHVTDGEWIWKRVESDAEVENESIRGYLVTYNSGELVDHFRARGVLPDGVHFMEGPEYTDNGERFSKRLVDNSMVEFAHGPSPAWDSEPTYYSTTMKNVSSERLRVTKFVGLWRRFRFMPYSDDGSGYYSPRQFSEWFRVPDRDGWIAPGESVTDPENWSEGAGIWAFFLETDSGRRFIATVPMPAD